MEGQSTVFFSWFFGLDFRSCYDGSLFWFHGSYFSRKGLEEFSGEGVVDSGAVVSMPRCPLREEV